MYVTARHRIGGDDLQENMEDVFVNGFNFTEYMRRNLEALEKQGGPQWKKTIEEIGKGKTNIEIQLHGAFSSVTLYSRKFDWDIRTMLRPILICATLFFMKRFPSLRTDLFVLCCYFLKHADP